MEVSELFRKDSQMFFLTENARGLDVRVTASSPANTFCSIHTEGESSQRHAYPWDRAKRSFTVTLFTGRHLG